MNKASMANWAEVKFGELAALNGKHVAVRKFGAQMVVDHNQALLDLKVIAFAWGVELPVVMDSLHNAKYRKLQGMSGYSFDTAYINSQIKDHDEAIALFQEEATGGDDKQLRNYAARYLPHLHMHREKIDSVNSVVR
jgi:putative membrane protein